jgi:putative ABC transport system permease protein
MLRLALNTLWTQRRSFVAVTLAVSLSVAFVMATLTVVSTLAQVARDANLSSSRNLAAVVRASALGDDGGFERPLNDPLLDASTLEVVTGVEGVAAVDGQVVGYAQLLGSDGNLVDPGAAAQRLAYSWSDVPEQNPYQLSAGTAPQQDSDIVLDANLAQRGTFSVGDTVRLVTRQPSQEFRVSGIARFGSQLAAPDISAVFLTRASAQRFVGQPNKLSSLLITAVPGVDETALAQRVQTALGSQGRVFTGTQWRERGEAAAEGDVAQYRSLLALFIVLSLALGTVVISNALALLSATRLRETALVRAIGASPFQTQTRTFAEAFGVGVIGSIVGIPTGIGVAAGLLALLQALNLAVRAGAPVVTFQAVLLAASLGVGVTLFAAVRPAWRAARTPPVAALREAATEAALLSPQQRVLASALMVVGCLGVTIGLWQHNLVVVAVSGLALTAGLWTLAPLLLRLVGGVFKPLLVSLGGAAGELAQINLLRAPKRAVASVGGLIFGVTVITLVLMTAASLEATFSERIDRGFSGELAVRPVGFNSGQTPGFPDEVREVVRQTLPGASLVTTRDAEAQLAGVAVAVTGVDDISRLPSLFSLGQLEGDLDAVNRGGVAASAAVASAYDLKLGSTVTLQFPGGERSFPVVALFERDTTLDVPLNGFVLARSALVELAPGRLDTGLFLKGTAPEAQTTLQAALPQYPTVQVQDKRSYVRAQEGDFRRIVTTVYTMLTLAVLVTLVGVSNALKLGVTERLRELSLLRGVGGTREQLFALVLWEALALTVYGVVFGFLLGLVLGGAFLTSVTTTSAPALSVRVPVAGSVVLLLAGLSGTLFLTLPVARMAARVGLFPNRLF